MSHRNRWLSACCALLLAGCSLAGPPAQPTPTPTPAPTLARLPSVTTPIEQPPAEPTPEPSQSIVAPTAPALPEEAIAISTPGPASRVVSPLHLEGVADPTFEQTLQVVLSGAENDMLATAPVQIQAEIGQRGRFALDLAFTVTAETPGRISVIDRSAKDGGIVHLASVEVTLLPGGEAEIHPIEPVMSVEQITLFAPTIGASAVGGKATVDGYAQYVFESILSVTVCGEGGSGAPDPVCGSDDNILGGGTAMLNAPDVSQPGLFHADIPYLTVRPVQGRIAIYSLSPRDGGILHLASRPITLAP